MLKKLRKKKRMTQLELAEKMGRNRSYISKLENQEYKDIGISTILDLSIALEEDFFELCKYYKLQEMKRREK
ncbi:MULTISPECIES: helix-turn-helix domain-containing protein [Clostridioides]|uniref:Transcriptional regulator n=1 Tax=Clostridioides difficile ATCC 9689 = DSM 1296 TaxID=1121308 RepID=A0AC59FV64_CLODI|nr:helix-turn-helix transcriptional regulator [Clostridioides difficile]MCC0685440.1 helix-turn-helix transcriptional regulator [Clostridioides sp. ZZV14-6345]AKP41220.1 putative transcriptional regulator [Clostridioides difficile ATCC 9689 = DSM 1296]ARC15106.1 XRE family transcriptional regulator [Clostridioides difficile]AVI10840.1 XRE family transcriptional regulator [Clostridioides difficile]EGT3737914.1 XRE family transcriptional regulator [Clostridioides difficile]